MFPFEGYGSGLWRRFVVSFWLREEIAQLFIV
jgi:hypothetical protein